MKVGLLSDTHGYLDPKVFEYFNQVDEIWHAGDIGTLSVTESLSHFKPLKAVFGNIDDLVTRQKFEEDLWFQAEDLTVWMTHIGGTPPHYNPRITKILKQRIPDVLICGHSHILKVQKDSLHNNLLFINPGAAGNHGFHVIRTLIRMEIEGKIIRKLEVIELGKRGAL